MYRPEERTAQHAIMGQYWASTGPMLPASDRYWHVQRKGLLNTYKPLYMKAEWCDKYAVNRQLSLDYHWPMPIPMDVTWPGDSHAIGCHWVTWRLLVLLSTNGSPAKAVYYCVPACSLPCVWDFTLLCVHVILMCVQDGVTWFTSHNVYVWI